MEDLLTELISINTEISTHLQIIEYYTIATGVAASLGLGLVLWRLIMLSKNQRSLF